MKYGKYLNKMRLRVYTFKISGFSWIHIYLIIITEFCDLICTECVYLNNNINYNMSKSVENNSIFNNKSKLNSINISNTFSKTSNYDQSLDEFSNIPTFLWKNNKQIQKLVMMGLNLSRFPDVKEVISI